jgi:hypothetical protein
MNDICDGACNNKPHTVVNLTERRARSKVTAGTPLPAGISDHAVRIDTALQAVHAAELLAQNTGRAYILAIMAVGDELLATQAKFAYGKFGPWLEANFELTARSANRIPKTSSSQS